MSTLQTVFDVFSIRFPERKKYAAFADDSAEALEDKLPAELISLMKEEGLFSFAEGLFIFEDPISLKEINKSWGLSDSEDQIFLRTAFGDLFYWDDSSVNILHVNTGVQTALSSDIADFLNYTFSEKYREKTLFGKLLKQVSDKLGPLKDQEVYGFIKPLESGGKEQLSNLAKIGIKEYHAGLAKPRR